MSIARSAPAPAYLDRNENPLGPSPEALRWIQHYLPEIHRYPAGIYDKCRHAVARYFGREPAEVLITTGVDESLDLFYSLGKSVLLFRPGYSAFEDRAMVCNKSIEWVQLEQDWSMPAASQWKTAHDLAVVASPHNPSGKVYPRRMLEELTSSFRYFFADETYIDFSRELSLLTAKLSENVILFRSFSKAFGLAGLRVGCMIGEKSTIQRMEERKQFYTVDTIALAGVLGVLQDPAYLQRAIDEVISQREWLFDCLVFMPGLRCWPSEASFLLIGVPDDAKAARLEREFRDSQIVVRENAGCGLKHHFRISIGTAAENLRVVEAVRRCFSS